MGMRTPHADEPVLHAGVCGKLTDLDQPVVTASAASRPHRDWVCRSLEG